MPSNAKTAMALCLRGTTVAIMLTLVAIAAMLASQA